MPASLTPQEHATHMTPLPPRTDAEIAAHTVHLAADLVLQHRLAQGFSWHVTEALLAVARQNPDVDQGAARQLVRAALSAIVDAEIQTSRRAA
jgi:hypothetical protein